METIGSNAQTNKRPLSWQDIDHEAERIAEAIKEKYPGGGSIYGIPRGGIYTAQAVAKYMGPRWTLTCKPERARVFVDDIIDSGATAMRYMVDYKAEDVYALYDKRKEEIPHWLIFPWEQMKVETGPTENIVRIFEYIGEDPEREGLRETPQRVIKSWDKLYGGYKEDPKSILKVFEEDSSDEMVILKDIEFYSQCEHHMLPFFGKAHIAYIPNKKVVGISKLARVLEVYARRLQIQERLCQQITGLLDSELQPIGSACVIEAQHACMTSRGVEKQNSIMVTSSLTGAFKEQPQTREELMYFIRG